MEGLSMMTTGDSPDQVCAARTRFARMSLTLILGGRGHLLIHVIVSVAGDRRIMLVFSDHQSLASADASMIPETIGLYLLNSFRNTGLVECLHHSMAAMYAYVRKSIKTSTTSTSPLDHFLSCLWIKEIADILREFSLPCT